MPGLPVIKVEHFEGPFDLLLELARAHKVDLSTISLTRITDDFIAYVDEHQLSSDLQADFVVVATTLLLLKVRELIPTLSDEVPEEAIGLSDRLRLYQLYREQALALRQRWDTAQLLPGPEQLHVEETASYPPYTPIALLLAMQRVIVNVKLPPDKRRHIRPHGKTLPECMALITHTLAQQSRVTFADVVADETSQTTAVTFLAALELARQQRVLLEQAELFSPIEVTAL